MKRNLRNLRAIVTGAACGIGRATALELARNGVGVVVVDRREDRLQDLVAQIAALGVTVEPVVGDITEPQTRQDAVDAARSKMGGLDLLVNNVGVGAMGLFENASPLRLRCVMETNFFAMVEMTRLALPMLKRGVTPMLVNVGSVCGLRGVPHMSEYSASKFAMHGFSESIRAEFGHLGIDVLVACPGTTETDFFNHLLERTGEPSWPKHKPVSAAHVGRAIVRAIRRGRHKIIPYRRAKILDWMNRLSPRFVDWLMAGFVGVDTAKIPDTVQEQAVSATVQAAQAAVPSSDGHRKPETAQPDTSVQPMGRKREKQRDEDLVS
jgi:short-subunit dehydrogenase